MRRAVFRLLWLFVFLLLPVLAAYTWFALRTLGDTPLSVAREVFDFWWEHFKLGGL